MADTSRVELALEGRPGAGEVAGILVACAVVFGLLVHFDGAAARDEARRARTALAKRAAAARRPAAGVETRRSGDRSLGDAGPITVPVQSAWGAGTSPAAGHARAASGAFRPPSLLLGLLAGVGAALALAGSALMMRGRR